MHQYSLSANIEEGFTNESQYIVTPNARQVAESIVDGFRAGIHSYTIIGSYGTGKSSFLLALERDLKTGKMNQLINPTLLTKKKKFEFLKIVGDYNELSVLLSQKMSIDETADGIIEELKNRYNKYKSQGKYWVIYIDEFGKVLEHAAKNNPERELYFIQRLAEFVNVPTRNILLLTTLHQNFNAYSRK